MNRSPSWWDDVKPVLINQGKSTQKGEQSEDEGLMWWCGSTDEVTSIDFMITWSGSPGASIGINQCLALPQCH